MTTRPNGRIRLPGPPAIRKDGPRVRQGDRLYARLREINGLDGVTVAIGLQGTGAPVATPNRPGVAQVGGDDLVQIGRAHEFGLGVPERPWLRTALARHGKLWVGGLKVALKQRAQGEYTAATLTLRQVGVFAVGKVQETIRTGPWVPNSPLTIALKGSSKPLIDTTQMINSVRATVEGPGLPTELVG